MISFKNLPGPLFTFIAFLITVQAGAQQIHFRTHSVTDGLNSNTVWTISQDDQGYMWFATVNGLQRYDGNGFITFKSNEKNPNAIPSTHIVALFLDNKKRLWLYGDNQKVGTFDTRKFIFKEAAHQNIPGSAESSV